MKRDTIQYAKKIIPQIDYTFMPTRFVLAPRVKDYYGSFITAKIVKSK